MPHVSRILAPACFHRADSSGNHYAIVLDLQEDERRRPSGGCVIGRWPHTDKPMPGYFVAGWGFKPRNLRPTGLERLARLRDADSGWTPCAPADLPPGSMDEIAAFAAEWTKDKNQRHTGAKGLFSVEDGRILVFEAGTNSVDFSSHAKLEVLMDLEENADPALGGLASTLASAFAADAR